MTTVTVSEELLTMGRAAREASRLLARLGTAAKDRTLVNIAKGLRTQQSEILSANTKDMESSRKAGLDAAMLDRLMLNPARLEDMAKGVEQIIALPDPVGEEFDARTLPNGIRLARRRVPLGVIGVIYESRPNVTIDIAALCLKSGNACILRGGSEAVHSNAALTKLIRQALADAGAPRDGVQFVESTDRALIAQMLRMKEYIDLLVPRGGDSLIRYVAENATMPAVTGGIGVCHTYVDKSANLEQAVKILENAKVQRPTVCNALDCVLVHSKAAPKLLPNLAKVLAKSNVELHCDDRSLALLGPSQASGARVKPAVPEDWGKEYLALILAVKVVDSLDEALKHIEQYGSGHTEAILTEDYSAATRFVDSVDAAAVMVNASTRFTDGGQFGLGAEVAISTSKMHARGPMGLRELTSYKWVVLGTGHVRP
ncbi:MAG: glutamate-5-semialdehyde dehydrogenase [Dehalococcoidia bacterium]|nr:glutamate-5-semialdehyde dehydrogenase [Dehalococcoidia bacterium]